MIPSSFCLLWTNRATCVAFPFPSSADILNSDPHVFICARHTLLEWCDRLFSFHSRTLLSVWLAQASGISSRADDLLLCRQCWVQGSWAHVTPVGKGWGKFCFSFSGCPHRVLFKHTVQWLMLFRLSEIHQLIEHVSLLFNFLNYLTIAQCHILVIYNNYCLI